MKIPIQNIFYLLCYAWNKLEEGERIRISSSDYETTLDLLARVLLNGCNQLFRRGLDRSYIEETEMYPGIKGKIDFANSLESGSFRMGKAVCNFDEFELDVLHNLLLKSTLYRLILTKGLEPGTKNVAWKAYDKFHGIRNIEIRLSDFARVRLHRNNIAYDFLLKVCRLIIQCTALDEKEGKYEFKSFSDDDKEMARLFEVFVRNFYRKECSQYFDVSSDEIEWIAEPISESGLDLLPKMRTDVTLRSNTRKIVLDAKFYSNTLSSYYGSQKLHSTNLYQLYSYLRNLEESSDDVLNRNCEGVLLYPTTQKEVDESFMLGSHKVHIATVDLNQDWRSIHNRLLQIVGS